MFFFWYFEQDPKPLKTGLLTFNEQFFAGIVSLLSITLGGGASIFYYSRSNLTFTDQGNGELWI